MALTQIHRSPEHDLGPDRRRFVATYVTSSANLAADTPAIGAAYAADTATAEPLTAHVTRVHILENWLPNIPQVTVEYTGLRGK